MISEDQSELSYKNRGGVTMVFGLYFCNQCNNMLTPINANGHILEFKCHICGLVSVDFSKRTDKNCMLYSKELQIGSKKYEADLAYVFDPTMPHVKTRCPNCDNPQAVYFLTPDEGETKIVAKMMCTSSRITNSKQQVKCGFIWSLSEQAQLLSDRVISNQVQFQAEDEQEIPGEIDFLAQSSQERF